MIHRIIVLILLFASFNGFCGDNPTTKPFTVVIDAGHGGHDPGALGKHSQEKKITLAIALKIGKLISENIPNVKVIYTRKTDVFVELINRAAIANKNDADLFISIHVNSNPSPNASGIDTWVMGQSKTSQNFKVAQEENKVILVENDYSNTYEGFDPNSTESYIIFNLMQNVFIDQSLEFATGVQNQVQLIGKKNRGVESAPFLVLWKTTMPSVLVETGFISNINDENYLITDEGQSRVATAVYRAFAEYKKKVENKTKIQITNLEEQAPNNPSTEKKIISDDKETKSNLLAFNDKKQTDSTQTTDSKQVKTDKNQNKPKESSKSNITNKKDTDKQSDTNKNNISSNTPKSIKKAPTVSVNKKVQSTEGTKTHSEKNKPQQKTIESKTTNNATPTVTSEKSKIGVKTDSSKAQTVSDKSKQTPKTTTQLTTNNKAQANIATDKSKTEQPNKDVKFTNIDSSKKSNKGTAAVSQPQTKLPKPIIAEFPKQTENKPTTTNEQPKKQTVAITQDTTNFKKQTEVKPKSSAISPEFPKQKETVNTKPSTSESTPNTIKAESKQPTNTPAAKTTVDNSKLQTTQSSVKTEKQLETANKSTVITTEQPKQSNSTPIKVQTTEKKPDPTKNKPVITDTPQIAQPVQKTADVKPANNIVAKNSEKNKTQQTKAVTTEGQTKTDEIDKNKQAAAILEKDIQKMKTASTTQKSAEIQNSNTKKPKTATINATVQAKPTAPVESSSTNVKPTEKNDQLKDTSGISFSLQIMSSTKKLNKDSIIFKGLNKLRELKINGSYKYLVGIEKEYEGASTLKEKIRTLFPDAFVVAFKNGEKIPVSQALEEKRNLHK